MSTTDILESIEHAIEDYSVSGDAMRWTPTTEGVPQPKGVIEPLPLPPVDPCTSLPSDMLRAIYRMSRRDREVSTWQMSRDTYRSLLRRFDAPEYAQNLNQSAILFGLPIELNERLSDGHAILVANPLGSVA